MHSKGPTSYLHNKTPMVKICCIGAGYVVRQLDYRRMFDAIHKPAFVFDGRNVVDVAMLREIGFVVYSIGKPLDDWLSGSRTCQPSPDIYDPSGLLILFPHLPDSVTLARFLISFIFFSELKR